MIFQIEIHGDLRRIELVQGESDGIYRVSIDGRPEIQLSARMLRPGMLSLVMEGRAYCCVHEESPEGTAIHIGGIRRLYRIDDPRSLRSRRRQQGGDEGPKPVTAPMPGRVVRVLAQAGDAVEAHQGIVVIEAMKMQNELKSPKAGKVVKLNAEAGSTVAAGDVLAVIE